MYFMSGKVIGIKRIQETVLWKQLEALGDTDAASLIQVLPIICEEAADHMKAMPATSPQYTLHDESHFLRVVEIMAMVLGETIRELNAIELCLLILSAYYHDLGMVMTDDEYSKLESNPDFNLFRDNWYLDHPNHSEILLQLRERSITDSERQRLSGLLKELNAAMLTDYLRVSHAHRSAVYLEVTFSSDKRLFVSGINLSSLLGKICESHYSNTNTLTPDHGYQYDEQIGIYKVNVPFVAMVLRLADILDFDADRTPEVLLKSTHFTSPISIQEWAKHRGVQGWEITEELIRYTANYTHPAYHSAALIFMDWVDKELRECQRLCGDFPAKFKRYKLLLPTSVDRSRIKPAKNAYIYHDLEISLSRNEIVKLLMTDKLYSAPHVCVRELLQNSLDAIRYRKALLSCGETSWNTGQVKFVHYINEHGYEVLECTDNGSGMDEDIIGRFFTNAGRSFYRSPEFERERVKFRKYKVDYDPCSQFGIGFMSCFMLGDRIEIETRRDYGNGMAWGTPLIVDINGLGGLITIRPGKSDQGVGTKVSITSNKKPEIIDSWSDKVSLIPALKRYAVATEFPIVGSCRVKGLEDDIVLPVTKSYVPTGIEDSGIDKTTYVTLEQEFNELSNNLSGSIRESFIIDSNDLPTIKNVDSKWVKNKKSALKSYELLSNGIRYSRTSSFIGSQISIDGIYLCGIGGRPEWQKDTIVQMRFGSRPTHTFGDFYSLDVRGELKPEITPARTPVGMAHWMGHDVPKWDTLNKIIHQASGKLWAKLLSVYVPKGLRTENLWKLFTIHNADICDIPLSTIWKYMSVPLTKRDKTTWIAIPELSQLSYIHEENESCFQTSDEHKVSLPANLVQWEAAGTETPSLQTDVNNLIISLSDLSIENDALVCSVSPPNDSTKSAAASAIIGDMTYISTLPFKGEINGHITAQLGRNIANSLHPLVQESLKSNQSSSLSKFASNFVACIVSGINSDEPNKFITKSSRWKKYCALYYFAIDWSKYEDKLLKPPYRIWFAGNKTIEILESDLQIWRDAELDT